MHNSWRSYRNMLLKSRNYKECTEGCCRYVTLSRMCGIVRSGKGRGGRRRRRSWWEWREGVGEDRKTRGGEGAKHFYKSLQFQLFVSISTLLRSLYCHTFLASCRKAHPNIVLPTPTQNRPWNFSFAWFSLKWFNRGRNVKYSYEKKSRNRRNFSLYVLAVLERMKASFLNTCNTTIGLNALFAEYEM